ncbi:tetratricopeptide repeat protein [bacterium]|nr:tetratricopeptide repeat protein [bacterium]
MSKQRVILLATAALFVAYGAAYAVPSGPFGYDLQADLHRTENKKLQEQQQQQAMEQNGSTENAEGEEQVDLTPKTAKDFYSFVPMKDLYVANIDSSKYYANPTMKSAIYRYKVGNYTGCLQELYSFIKNPKNVNNAYAYYYMGLAYSKLGESTAAKNCFQKAINCDAKGKLLELAVKGRDCISGGIYCHTPVNPSFEDIYKNSADPLDAFIYAPYSGNGFSPEAEMDYQQRKLKNMQKKINQENEKKTE